MTIAACYLSSEGVVFGADSTTTMYVSGIGPGVPGAVHHYNFAQKIYEIGENSTLAMTMWGMGSLPTISYRTLIARFADALASDGAQAMADVADRWNRYFWSAYSEALGPVLQRAQQLRNQPERSEEEDRQWRFLMRRLSGGFCIGGYLRHDRAPSAYEILYDPTLTNPAPARALSMGRTGFWGCPNLINRLIYGLDEDVVLSILRSGRWSGTEQQLFDLLVPYCLGQPLDLPIREAIDWVHASIYTTIKTMKFSHLEPVCGGPVEIAVISTDRRFRWVRHKKFDAAIGEGGLFDVYHD